TDVLIALHDTGHSAGFGALDAAQFVSDWRELYRPLAQKTLKKSARLTGCGLPERAYGVMERAMERFDDVFCLPITKAGLIHGDYNTWNILLTPDLQHVQAVIDPFNCGWADPEFDLYQLDNANGKAFGLLKKYAHKRKLSDNFEEKRRFYELFTELNHYSDAGVPLGSSHIPQQAEALRQVL
ncbi:MAG: phosphotransferase, partial [Eubacteriales bacterium]|nr:phosphotransferase [Eubacteriales bacterium]